jgi:hypothetical protein
LISSVKATNAVAGSTPTSTSDATDTSVTRRLPFHVALERVELLVPLRLQLVQPGLKSDQPIGTEMKHAQSGVFLASLVGHHAGMEEHPEVSAHGGCGETSRLSQLAGAHGPAPKQFDDVATRGVRQRAEESVDIHRHRDNS